MLSSLQIQNFRGLKDVKISSLGRVNLIVGENNAGKSSVLEALLVYASGASPYILENITQFHHEEGFFEFHKPPFLAFYDNATPFIGLFHNRKYPNNKNENIRIGEIDKNILELSYSGTRNPFINTYFNGIRRKEMPLIIQNENHYLNLNKGEKIYSFKYIPTQIKENKRLADYWDKIILTPYENEVIKSLQIIEPDIEKLAFINQPFNDERIPMVGLKNSDKPVPLYSMGDGIKRILQLILNLHQAKDGLLLIDEFDNGLHYKVQEKVWGLLFELAERFNVQVFATTHSNDCIRAFSKISKERTDIDGMLIQMTKEHYKDGTSQIVANVVDENQLQRLLNLGVDVR